MTGDESSDGSEEGADDLGGGCNTTNGASMWVLLALLGLVRRRR
jgi:uncharacterized protein (TIGR03382 family)